MKFKVILSTLLLGVGIIGNVSAGELHSGDYGFIAGAAAGAVVAAPAGPQASGIAALAGGTAGSVAFSAGQAAIKGGERLSKTLNKKLRKLRR